MTTFDVFEKIASEMIGKEFTKEDCATLVKLAGVLQDEKFQLIEEIRLLLAEYSE